ncbi:cation:proton antiporter domain-containing protein [Gemmatimonas sp.]|uniref:cation:proton antiporter domain-containing protein n=1 Tax=Gemmatimonas sp. TaxID=1962908 RepID=UPI003F717431
MTRTSPVLYIALVGVPVLIIAALLQVGSTAFVLPAETFTTAAPAAAEISGAAAPASPVAFSLGRLVLQLVVILSAARLFGMGAKAIGQPAVIGEMLAGIALGPSLLGSVAPALSTQLFPASSLTVLNGLSQLGVLLFLFLVGLHVDVPALRRQRSTAVVASHASIAAPFTLGVALALFLFPHYAPPGVAFSAFALFIGVAMSITAFPVLARILDERGLLDTPIGTLAVACAAVDDVTAWMLLAAVVALVQSGGAIPTLLQTLAGTVAFVLLMFRVVRPLFARLATGDAASRVPAATLSLLLLLVLLAALGTESLGIHALFGAFVAGTIVPRQNSFADRVANQLGDLLVVMLLPLFFAYTGLRTDFNMIAGASAWWPLFGILGVAIVGKVGGTTLAARASGQSWHAASTLGVLMNTRGLMELVVLNIGLDLGVLSPPLFAMMVVMALVTTTMTVPSLVLLDRWSHKQQAV